MEHDDSALSRMWARLQPGIRMNRPYAMLEVTAEDYEELKTELSRLGLGNVSEKGELTFAKTKIVVREDGGMKKSEFAGLWFDGCIVSASLMEALARDLEYLFGKVR